MRRIRFTLSKVRVWLRHHGPSLRRTVQWDGTRASSLHLGRRVCLAVLVTPPPQRELPTWHTSHFYLQGR